MKALVSHLWLLTSKYHQVGMDQRLRYEFGEHDIWSVEDPLLNMILIPYETVFETTVGRH